MRVHVSASRQLMPSSVSFLIQYFIDNTHKLTLIMRPSPEFEAKQKKTWEEMQHNLVDKLSDNDKKNLLKEGRQLLEAQSLKEDIRCLPTLKGIRVNRNMSRTAPGLLLWIQGS